jgi:hypothetical protein
MTGGRIALKETPDFAVFVENGRKRLRSMICLRLNVKPKPNQWAA